MPMLDKSIKQLKQEERGEEREGDKHFETITWRGLSKSQISLKAYNMCTLLSVSCCVATLHVHTLSLQLMGGNPSHSSLL